MGRSGAPSDFEKVFGGFGGVELVAARAKRRSDFGSFANFDLISGTGSDFDPKGRLAFVEVAGDFRTIVVGRVERVGRSGTYCPPRVPGSREVGTWTLGQVEFHRESKQGGRSFGC